MKSKIIYTKVIFLSFILILSLFINSCEKKKDKNPSKNVKTEKVKKTKIHKEIVKKTDSYKKGIDQARKSMKKINKKNSETEDLIANIRGSKKTSKKSTPKIPKKRIKSIRTIADTQVALYKKSKNLDKCIKRVRRKYNNKDLAGSIKYQFEIL